MPGLLGPDLPSWHFFELGHLPLRDHVLGLGAGLVAESRGHHDSRFKVHRRCLLPHRLLRGFLNGGGLLLEGRGPGHPHGRLPDLRRLGARVRPQVARQVRARAAPGAAGQHLRGHLDDQFDGARPPALAAAPRPRRGRGGPPGDIVAAVPRRPLAHAVVVVGVGVVGGVRRHGRLAAAACGGAARRALCEDLDERAHGARGQQARGPPLRHHGPLPDEAAAPPPEQSRGQSRAGAGHGRGDGGGRPVPRGYQRSCETCSRVAGLHLEQCKAHHPHPDPDPSPAPNADPVVT
mmetsp:Transcript_96134/g.276159  ORF Transcript_96134/g.276159 Transcript_96134/m.276159 type:complete len:292 (-) Transcript_96134:94-969(-)